MEGQLPITNKAEFKAFTEAFWQDNKQPTSFGIGFVTTDEKGEICVIRWERINNGDSFGTAACLMHHLDIVNECQEGMVQISFSAEDGEEILLNYFGPFDGEPGHANIDALKAGIEISKDKIGFIVVIMYFDKPEEISVEENDEVHDTYHSSLLN